MSAESQNRFSDDIAGRIDYFRAEYEMTYGEIIGCLELLKGAIVAEALELESGDDETHREPN